MTFVRASINETIFEVKILQTFYKKKVDIEAHLTFLHASSLQVPVVMMAVAATISAVPLEYSMIHPVEYANDLVPIHSLSKRSPTPFKKVNPIIAKLTKGKSIPFTAPINKLICKFTFCKNKKLKLENNR